MRRVLFLVCALLVPVIAPAQTLVSPTSSVAFTPSSDHAALNEDGSAVVTAYELRVMRFDNQTALFFTYALGKPIPVSGEIIVGPISAFATLTRAVQYVARVAAVGPGGEGISELSAPFVYPYAPPAVPGGPGAPRIVE